MTDKAVETETADPKTADAAADTKADGADAKTATEGTGDAEPGESGKDTVDPAAKVEDKGKAGDKSPDKAGDKKPEPTTITDEGEDEEPAKDAKDAKPKAPDWATQRAAAVEREVKRLEAQLAKTLTAEQLPKELAKRRSALEKQLGRYASLEDALIAGFNAQEKIRSGQVKSPLPADATEEEVAEWRKQNGIPDKAEAYDIPAVPGHKWTEADAPNLSKLKAAAFAGNWPQEVVSGVATLFAQLRQEAAETLAQHEIEQDKTDARTTREALRSQFGDGEYKPSIALLNRYLSDEEIFPDGIGEQLATARFTDGPLKGRRVLNNPVVAAFLIEQARAQYGEGALLSGDAQAQIADERAELAKLRDSDIDSYMNKPWRNTGMTASQRAYELDSKEASRGRRAA